MSDDKRQILPTCPLCGEKVKICKGRKLRSGYEIIYDWIEFECLNDSCQMNIHFDKFDEGITIAEALARFSARPESAWDMWSRLCTNPFFGPKWIKEMEKLGLKRPNETDAKFIMEKIEKELKNDH